MWALLVIAGFIAVVLFAALLAERRRGKLDGYGGGERRVKRDHPVSGWDNF